MNKFLHYINDILISLDIPPIIGIEESQNLKGLKKQSNRSSQKHQK